MRKPAAVKVNKRFVPDDAMRAKYSAAYPPKDLYEFGTVSISRVHPKSIGHSVARLVLYFMLAIFYNSDLLNVPLTGYPLLFWEWRAFGTLVALSLVYFAMHSVSRVRRKLTRDAETSRDFDSAFKPHETSLLFRAGLIFRTPYFAAVLCVFFFQSIVIQAPIGRLEFFVPIITTYLIAAFLIDKKRTLLSVWLSPAAPKFAARILRGALGGNNLKASAQKMLDAMDD